MPVQQLDLFGTPLKPPQKIKEDIPLEASKRVITDVESEISQDHSSGQTVPEPNAPVELLPSIAPNNHDVDIKAKIEPQELVMGSAIIEHAEIEEANGFSETELNEVVDDVFTVEFEGALESHDEEENQSIENLSAAELEQIKAPIDGELLIDEVETEEFTNKCLPIIDGLSASNEITDEEAESTPTEGESFQIPSRTLQPVLRGRKPINHYDEEAENLRIPTDDILFKRQYYNMRETAAMFGLNQSLLRFWENEFTVLQPKKNKKGDRYFRPADIKNLHLIYTLLRVRKFTMEGAKEFLQKNKKASDQFDLVNKLDKLKLFLLELKATL